MEANDFLGCSFLSIFGDDRGSIPVDPWPSDDLYINNSLIFYGYYASNKKYNKTKQKSKIITFDSLEVIPFAVESNVGHPYGMCFRDETLGVLHLKRGTKRTTKTFLRALLRGNFVVAPPFFLYV